MPQFETQVPDPLRADLPGFLSGGGMRAPAVGILFLVFISQSGLKGSPMQIQLDDIAGGERFLGQHGEEEFVDEAIASHAHAALRLACRMGRHHDTTRHTRWSHWYLGAVVEGTRELAFRTLLVLIGGQVQPCLDERMVQHGIVFATQHKRETSQLASARPPCHTAHPDGAAHAPGEVGVPPGSS